MNLETTSVVRVNCHKMRIEINPAFPHSRKAEGLLHEIIEALNYHLGLNLDHDKQLVPLSEGLYQVLTDNTGEIGKRLAVT
jgi:hypothetical protein